MNEQQIPEKEPTANNHAHKHLAHPYKRILFFGILALIFVGIFCLVNLPSVSAFLSDLGDLLSPVIIGCVIAYLCNPILEFYEYRVLRRMSKTGIRRGLSLLLAILTMIGLIALLLLMVIPELVDSLMNLATNYEVYLDGLLGFVQNIINSLAAKFEFGTDVIQDVQQLKDMLFEFLGEGEDLMNKIETFITEKNVVGEGIDLIISIFSTFFDIILGIIIALYILASKEKRIAQIRKFRKAVLNDKQNSKVTEITNLVSHTFSGYVFGVLIDALVVGVLTFVLLTIFNVSPYNLLIATLCAVTNIIPVFGPFIGAIPSAFIVLISNPSKFFLFLILILLIQQIDGNLLCPKIQGDNTGISSLAVLVTITIAGAEWGFVGLLVGVPICAVIIELVKRALDNRLTAMGEPTDTVAYYPEDALGNAEKDVHYEHSGLLYQYEHSALKPKVEKFKARLYKIMGYKGKAEDPSKDASQDAEAILPETEAQGPDGDGAALADDTTETVSDVTAEDDAAEADGHGEEAYASSAQTTSSNQNQ